MRIITTIIVAVTISGCSSKNLYKAGYEMVESHANEACFNDPLQTNCATHGVSFEEYSKLREGHLAGQHKTGDRAQRLIQTADLCDIRRPYACTDESGRLQANVLNTQ